MDLAGRSPRAPEEKRTRATRARVGHLHLSSDLALRRNHARRVPFRTDGGDDRVRVVKVAGKGTAYARGICFQTSRDHVGQRVYVVYETDSAMFFDDQGTLIAEYPHPAPGTRYVGSGKPRGRRPKTLPLSPMS